VRGMSSFSLHLCRLGSEASVGLETLATAGPETGATGFASRVFHQQRGSSCERPLLRHAWIHFRS
jgi:hypothetical protein